MKDLYTENYKTLMKEIKEDTNKWKDDLCSRIGIKTVKMCILLNEIYKLHANSMKIPMVFFTEIEQTII